MMKKILCLLFASVALLSCRKEETPAAREGIRSFAAIASESAQEKTSLSPEGSRYWVIWSRDDRISVNGHTYRLTSGENSNQGTFAAVSSGASAPFTAIYPASARISDTKISLPAEQVYAANSAHNTPMYASGSGTTLFFSNLCGLFRLQLSGTGSVSTLTLSADQPLSGTADLIKAEGDTIPGAVVSSGAGKITINCSTPVNLADGPVFLVYAPVNRYTNLTLSLVNSAGYDCRRRFTSTVSLTRGKVTPITLTRLAFDRWNGHRFVDLGLPSERRWAATNLGADEPMQRGDYYAWGATTPFYSSLDPLSWKSGKSAGYVLVNAPFYNSGSYSKYTVEGAVLDSSDDAAAYAWGERFRVAQESHWRELMANCFWMRTDSYRSTGRTGFIVFMAKAGVDKGACQLTPGGSAPSGSNYDVASDAHIFLPACGYFDGTSLQNTATDAYYYCANIATTLWKNTDILPSCACVLYFGYDGMYQKDLIERYYGFSLRPVIEKSADETK